MARDLRFAMPRRVGGFSSSRQRIEVDEVPKIVANVKKELVAAKVLRWDRAECRFHIAPFIAKKLGGLTQGLVPPVSHLEGGRGACNNYLCNLRLVPGALHRYVHCKRRAKRSRSRSRAKN